MVPAQRQQDLDLRDACPGLAIAGNRANALAADTDWLPFEEW